MKHGTKKHFSKMDRGVIAISLLTLALTFFAQAFVFDIFQQQQYLAIHLIIGIIIILGTFHISFQAWTQYPHTHSRQQLWLGALFLFIGFLELFQVNAYIGMPLFHSTDPLYQPFWFYMISRLGLGFGILLVLMPVPNDRSTDTQNRRFTYSLAIVYILIWTILVLSPAQLLPRLLDPAEGGSTLKISLHIVAMLAQLISAFLLFRKRVLRSNDGLLLIASIHFVIGDAIFIFSAGFYDLHGASGHFFQLMGYYFLIRSFYHSWTEEPFQKQKAAENQLRRSEDFLHMLVSQMQEGIIVTDPENKLTYCNAKTEQLLQWSASELLGKDLDQLMRQYYHDCDNCPYENCAVIPMSCYQQLNRHKEDYLVRKNGTLFPVSYTRTPLLEDGQNVGAMIVFVDITQQKKDQEYINFMAYHDELTKLPNARYFSERLDESIARDPAKQRAVIMLDIDRFKTMNDSLGDAHGDMILESVSLRLRGSLPPKLFMGRLRGNHFAILLPFFKDEQEIIQVCQQVQQILGEPFLVQHLLLKVTLNMGIAIYPDHGENQQDLCKHAQIAMHEAKKDTKRYLFYHHQMDRKSLERLMLELDLHNALANEELHLFYQPKTDLCTGRILSLEALIRWKHPQHGWVSPDQFIPIAEETGLIVPIGEWVLRTACQQLKTWHDQGLPLIGVSVNLSTRQFFQQNLVEMIENVLAETRLDASYLELEITESMTINEKHAIEILQKIKQLGIKIAVDDFGTGYSSLYYLKKLPLDKLKIDQSFVRDMLKDKHHAAIIAMIVSIAQQLQLEVVAEGVEDEEQLTFLWEQQCCQGQGYLFSPPLPAQTLSQEFYQIQERAMSYTRGLQAAIH